MEEFNGAFGIRHRANANAIKTALEPGEFGLDDSTGNIWFRDYANNRHIANSKVYHNVLDYEGVDDTTTFNNAIEAAKNASPPGIVLIPNGSYTIEGVRIYSHTHIIADRGARLVPVSGSDFMFKTDPADQIIDVSIRGVYFRNENISIPMKCIKITQDDANPSAFANQGIYIDDIRIDDYVHQGIELMGKQYGQCYLRNILMRRLVPVAAILGVAQARDATSFGVKVTGPVDMQNIEIIGSFHKGIWFAASIFSLNSWNICGTGNLADIDDYWMHHAIYIDASQGIVGGSSYGEKYYVPGLRPIDEQPILITGASRSVELHGLALQEGSIHVEDGCFDVRVYPGKLNKGNILNKSADAIVSYSGLNNSPLNGAATMYSPFAYGITAIGPARDTDAGAFPMIQDPYFYQGYNGFTTEISVTGAVVSEDLTYFIGNGDRSIKLVTSLDSKFILFDFESLVANEEYVVVAVVMADGVVVPSVDGTTSVNGNGVYGACLKTTSNFTTTPYWRHVVIAVTSTDTHIRVKLIKDVAGTMYVGAVQLFKGKYNFQPLMVEKI